MQSTQPSFTPEYCLSEMCTFREMFGDRRISIERLDKAFGGLYFLMVNTEGTPKEKSIINANWESICSEWPRRRALMIQLGLGGSDE